MAKTNVQEHQRAEAEMLRATTQRMEAEQRLQQTQLAQKKMMWRRYFNVVKSGAKAIGAALAKMLSVALLSAAASLVTRFLQARREAEHTFFCYFGKMDA